MPSFLSKYDHMNITQEHHRLAARHLSNWNALHLHITELPDARSSLVRLEALMAIELKSDAPRAHIIERLHGKYDRMRRTVEFSELQKHVPGLVKRER